MNEKTFHFALLSIVLLFLIWSGIKPHDRFTWLLEVLPVIIGIIVLTLTFGQYKFTILCYLLITIHMIILMIGGHYTYAQVPLFNWIKDAFELSRNHYDRIGHFAQGFVPAIITREILLRKSSLKRGKLLAAIVICICLAISAFYELIEWWVALATGTAADAFLGTQGDVWDTQWDMALALSGAVISLLMLSRIHDRYLRDLY